MPTAWASLYPTWQRGRIGVMRGHIVKVTTGGRALEEYLKGCNQAGQGLEAYLGEHGDGLRFHRYADGVECSSKRLRDGGLEMLQIGRAHV